MYQVVCTSGWTIQSALVYYQGICISGLLAASQVCCSCFNILQCIQPQLPADSCCRPNPEVLLPFLLDAGRLHQLIADFVSSEGLPMPQLKQLLHELEDEESVLCNVYLVQPLLR